MRHSDLWYKDAIIYCLDVETYMDSNGDGIGDFEGLTHTLNYISGLGVNTLWLLPFFPTPNRDNGYDVKDYYSVDPRLGTLGDFVEFIHRARDHGLRVIIDLVLNHTSIDHPWFQAARQDKSSKYRDYYIWRDEKPEDADEGVIFPGEQESTWTYDEVAEQYYFHRFYKHQPDVNITNPHVQEEFRKVMGFWLELGVNGFRIDAAPFVVELKGLEDVTKEDQIDYLQFFRHFLQWRKGNGIMIAEANVAMDKVPLYFGEGDRMHMLFNFMANQYLFASLAFKSAEPLKKVYEDLLPDIPDMAQWGQFLRNHDELSLDKLDKETRNKVFEVFAPEENMRIYNRGIRRRLAPILGNDRKQIELANSLMLTLPGTPIIRYGQEIGMGEDLSLEERNSVRTPMQWSDEKNGGFSSSDEELIRPIINHGDYGFEKVNVAKQRLDDNSLLNWMHKAIRIRKQCPEFGFGDFRLIETGNPNVFTHRCQGDDSSVMAIHNFSDEATEVSIDLDMESDTVYMVDLIGGYETKVDGTHHDIQLEPYGYRWFRVKSD